MKKFIPVGLVVATFIFVALFLFEPETLELELVEASTPTPILTIQEQLENLNKVTRKARLSLIITSYDHTGIYTDPNTKVTIEILSVNTIPQGIEAIARAWNANGEKLGFGIGGSIEWERVSSITFLTD